MKKRIENYLPRAIEIISEVEIADKKDIVDNRFNGYFSAFGASIVLAGMKPALAFYSNKKTVGDRTKILSAVYKLINNIDSNTSIEPKELLKYYIKNENNKMMKHIILDATIALKLAVRTYKLVKND